MLTLSADTFFDVIPALLVHFREVVFMQGERAFLRVREAAPMLGISVSAAYVLANIWLGRPGLLLVVLHSIDTVA
jgi:hypothetical protein